MTRPSVEVTPGVFLPRRHVGPPALLAHRMQRYSVALILIAFGLIGVNLPAMTTEKILWFAAGVAMVFSLVAAIAVVILNALAWNFDRMREELKGGRQATDMR